MNESTIRQDMQADLPPPTVVEEFYWLMSLALDAMLDASETLRFEQYLTRYPSLAAVWETWQTVDRHFTDAPHAMPVAGFVYRFEQKLAVREQRQMRWLASVVIATVLLASIAATITTLGAGAFVLLTQGQWIGQQIHQVAYFSTSMSNWFSAVTVSLNTLANTPQAQILGLVYLAIVATLILTWVQLLQHSTRLSNAIPAAGTIGLE